MLDFEPGEVFGVLNEPPSVQRSALVVAVTDCEVVRIPAEAAGQAMAVAPDLAAMLEQIARDQAAASRSCDSAGRSARPLAPPSSTQSTRVGNGR